MPSDFAPLLRDPLTITVAGTRILLPYRPAAVWAKGLERLGQLAAVLADDDGRETLVDLLIDHPAATRELMDESVRILGEASGLKWWEAGRLMSTSVNTEILGRMVLSGADPWNRSLGEWCAAVYALCVKGKDEKGRLRFDFTLSLPPPGYEDEWDDGIDDPEAVAQSLAKMTGKK